MRFNISNFILVATFITSCMAVIFGGMALSGNKWLVNKKNQSIGLDEDKDAIYSSFYTVGYAFQAIATCLIFVILVISILYDSFAQKWNMYVIMFIAIITKFLMGLIIMTLSAVRFLTEANKCLKKDTSTTPCYPKENNEGTVTVPSYRLELSFLSSHSFICYMINFFCSIIVIGLIFFSLGYMSNEDDGVDSAGDDDDSIGDMAERETDFMDKTLNANAFHNKKLTDKPAPNMTPAPNSAVQLTNYNRIKRDQ